MRLIYKCGLCGGMKAFQAPLSLAQRASVEAILAAINDHNGPFDIHLAIRHPCKPGTDGIAHLVGVEAE